MSICNCKKEFNGRLYNLHWSFQNTKLEKDRIAAFSIPAYEDEAGVPTCPMASECVAMCYARQGRYVMQHARRTRQHNFDFLRAERANDFRLFVAYAVEDIRRFPSYIKSVRIHDSGDFFSRRYLEAWIDIMRELPDVKFFAYTKMVSFVIEARGSLPPNFRFVQSVGGKQDHLIDPTLPHSVIFADVAERDAYGYEDGNTSDVVARDSGIKIGLVYHGTRTLTERPGTLTWLNNLKTASVV